MEPDPDPTPSSNPGKRPRLDIDTNPMAEGGGGDDIESSQSSNRGCYLDKNPIAQPLASPAPEDTGTSKEAGISNTTASDLGLLEDDGKPRLIAFKFAKGLPLSLQAMQPVTSPGVEKDDEDTDTVVKSMEWRFSSFEELPQDCTGKLLVYKSGAVKLTLGAVRYNVTLERDSSFYDRRVMSINAKDGQCFDFGQVTKTAIATVEYTDHMQD